MLLIKKRDNFGTAQSKDKVQAKAAALESAVDKLLQEQRELEAKLASIQKMVDDNAAHKLDTFARVVRPLDDTRKLAQEEAQAVARKIARAEQRIASLDDDAEQAQADLEAQKAARSELIEQKLALHKKMDEYKANYPDELLLFYEEEKNKAEVDQLRQRQAQLKGLLRDANGKRDAVRDEIFKLDDKIATLQEDYDIILQSLATASKAGESEIVKIEAFVSRSAAEYDAPSLGSLVDRVCLDRFCYSTRHAVAAKQARLVEALAEQAALAYSDKLDATRADIAELQAGIATLKPKVRAIFETPAAAKSVDEQQRDSKVVARFRAKVGSLKQCLETLRSTKLEARLRAEQLDAWLLKTKARLAKEADELIDSDELLTAELDNSVLEAFLTNTLYKIEDFGSKKKLEEMLGFYVDKVARREKAIQD